MQSSNPPKAYTTPPPGIAQWIPGVGVLRNYQRGWLPKDLVAGLVLSALLVPQGMAYAELAGLPPITGLYTTVICLVAYAFFGPSPFLVLGPDSSLGPIIAATVLPLAAGSQEEAIALAGMLALFVGIVCIAGGLARLGFVSDLLSRPVRVGYLAGLAVTIFVGQLPKLFGFSTDASGLLNELVVFLQNLDQTNVWALAIGLIDLFVILLLKRRKSKVPGVLVAVIFSITAVTLLNLTAQGVSVVGTLPQGFPRPSLPSADLADLPLLIGAAFGIALVVVGDTISTSVGFAARRGIEVNSNQELVGIGSANLLSSLFQGFPVSTSGSRTAVAEQAGAKTQLTGLVAAGIVLTMLLFIPGLVRNLPQSALAAVVITASISLFDMAEIRRIWAMRRAEFFLVLACALGVVFVGVLQGIVIAIVLSVLQFFERAWRPYSTVLGQPDDVPGYHDITRYPQATLIPGLLIIRWDAPLFFANANLFRDMIRRRIAEADPTPRWILVAAEPITDVDTTAAEILIDLDEDLNAHGIHLVFAEMKDPVKDKIVRYGLLETIDQRHFYPTLEAAVAAFQQDTASTTAVES